MNKTCLLVPSVVVRSLDVKKHYVPPLEVEKSFCPKAQYLSAVDSLCLTRHG